MRSQPIFRPSVFANHVFTTTEVNHAKQKVFQANVFNTQRAFTPVYVIPAVFSGTFNNLAFQSYWSLTKAEAEVESITHLPSIKIMGRVRAVITELLGLSETNNSPRGRYGYASTTMSISEVNSRARELARSLSNVISVTHFRGTARFIARTVAEELMSITEIVPYNFRARLPSIAESISITELSIARFLTKSHDTLEKIGMLETNDRVRGLARSLELRYIGISETAKTLRPRIRSLAETMTVRLNNGVFQPIFNNETFNVSSGLVWLRGKYRVSNVTVGITETNDRIRTIVRQLTNLLGITETNNRLRVLARSIIENLGITETNLRFRELTRILANNIGLTETNNRARILARSLSTVISVVHFRGRTRFVGRAISEAIGMTEINTMLRPRIRQLTEVAGIIETLERVRIMVRSLSENLGITDTNLRMRVIARVLATELLGMTETASDLRARLRERTESLGITHTVGRSMARIRSVLEVAGIMETSTRMKLIIRSLAETAVIIEVINRLRGRVINVLHTISATESQPFKLQGFVRLVSEVVVITHFRGQIVKEGYVRIKKIARLFGRGRTVKTYKRGRSVKGADR